MKNSDKSLDNSELISYDISNDDEYEVIKVGEHEPIHDVDCKHETLVANPEDTIGEAVYHGCANKHCGVGFYIKI